MTEEYFLPGQDACKTKTQTLPHETYCDKYYKCIDGQTTVAECPNGLVYLGKPGRSLVGVCDYDFNVECGERSNRSKFYFYLKNNLILVRVRGKWQKISSTVIDIINV
ncbi:hypothetical protein QYM36_015385 [Artemia franciscana]|uniref:Chitin-binding type-2 domain-containing protein n=1 Tax=Artemia franciscana TaxID=6661 RepID=A0AA88HEV5_ARTSF|nr:hypothetical protein QYM36_015385 [Artemia franciscana]